MVTRNKLPLRRQRILEFIQDFITENGIPPTVRDIQRACVVSSTSVVDYNLHKLKQAGYLNRRPDVARGIELLDEGGQPVSGVPRVQIVGAIAAGMPIPVFSTEDAASSAEFDTIEVSPDLSRRYGKLYGLTVNGTSMIDALIDDGDVVIVKPGPEAANGENGGGLAEIGRRSHSEEVLPGRRPGATPTGEYPDGPHILQGRQRGNPRQSGGRDPQTRLTGRVRPRMQRHHRSKEARRSDLVWARLSPAIGQSSVGCHAEGHAEGQRYFPVKSVFPICDKDRVALIQQGQDRTYYYRHH